MIERDSPTPEGDLPGCTDLQFLDGQRLSTALRRRDLYRLWGKGAMTVEDCLAENVDWGTLRGVATLKAEDMERGFNRIIQSLMTNLAFDRKPHPETGKEVYVVNQGGVEILEEILSQHHLSRGPQRRSP